MAVSTFCTLTPAVLVVIRAYRCDSKDTVRTRGTRAKLLVLTPNPSYGTSRVQGARGRLRYLCNLGKAKSVLHRVNKVTKLCISIYTYVKTRACKPGETASIPALILH